MRPEIVKGIAIGLILAMIIVGINYFYGYESYNAVKIPNKVVREAGELFEGEPFLICRTDGSGCVIFENKENKS